MKKKKRDRKVSVGLRTAQLHPILTVICIKEGGGWGE